MGRYDRTDALEFLDREGVERMVWGVGRRLTAAVSRGVERVCYVVGF